MPEYEFSEVDFDWYPPRWMSIIAECLAVLGGIAILLVMISTVYLSWLFLGWLVQPVKNYPWQSIIIIAIAIVAWIRRENRHKRELFLNEVKALSYFILFQAHIHRSFWRETYLSFLSQPASTYPEPVAVEEAEPRHSRE